MPVEPSNVLVAVTRLRRETDLLLGTLAQDFGLHLSDFRALSIIRVTSPTTPNDIATYLRHSMSTTTATIDRLVRTGYVQRTPNPDDRRSVYLEVTPSGAAAVDEAVQVFEKALADAVPERSRNALSGSLSRIAQAFSAASEQRASGPSSM